MRAASFITGLALVGLVAWQALGDPVKPSIPGAINPAVTQDNIDSTICRTGWTATVRPDKAYTDNLKRQAIGPQGKMGDYEEDHLIPLELGGHPTDPNNLWAQPWAGKLGAHTKDKLENRLHDLVCAHKMVLKAAQDCIRVDWVACYKRMMP